MKIEILFIRMKLLINESEFKNHKSRDMIPIECEYCHNTFYSQKNNVLWSRKRNSQKYLRFCNKRCEGQYNINKIEVKCENCNNYIIFVVCCSFRGHRG